MIPERPLESLAPCLVGRDGKPLVRNALIDSQALGGNVSEEELLDEEDEADMSLLPQNVIRFLSVCVWVLAPVNVPLQTGTCERN